MQDKPHSNALVPFKPGIGFGNRHLQATLSSSPWRKSALKKRFNTFLSSARQQVIHCNQGIKLAGALNCIDGNKKPKGLVILFHGWEGSSQSNYIVSAATSLLSEGFEVFRLNFRDHGDTCHLNKGIFNSSLIDEVISAIAHLQLSTQYSRYGVMGFSLGGNFALRAALRSARLPKPLFKTLAVCPVLDPAHTMQAMEKGLFWYEQYFVRKWKRSLTKKLQYFPEYGYGKELKKMNSLAEMNDFFIPRYTGFNSVETYFSSYTLTGETLAGIDTPTHILASKDDPVIPVSDFAKLAKPKPLTVTLTRQGSHCAYLRSISGRSWIDDFAVNYFTCDEKAESSRRDSV